MFLLLGITVSLSIGIERSLPLKQLPLQTTSDYYRKDNKVNM